MERESDDVVGKSVEAEAQASLNLVLSGVEAVRSDLATLCDCVSDSDDTLQYPRRPMVHALPGGSVVQPWSKSMPDWQACRVDFGEQRSGEALVGWLPMTSQTASVQEASEPTRQHFVVSTRTSKHSPNYSICPCHQNTLLQSLFCRNKHSMSCLAASR